MIVSISSDYLNADSCNNGDIVEFVDEGKAEVKTYGNKDRERYTFTVLLNGKTMLFSPSDKTLRSFITQYGTETKTWIGKKWTVKKVTMDIKGKELEIIRANTFLN